MRRRFLLAWKDRYTVEGVLTREPTPRWLRTRGLAALVMLALIALGQASLAADNQGRIGDVLSAVVGVRTQGTGYGSYGRNRVSSLEDFYRKLWATGPAGVEVQLLVLRRAQLLSIKVRSGDRYSGLRLNPI